MKEEIKEILEETKRLVDVSHYKEHYHLQDYFEVEHIAKLLDYITNLQEENERLNLELSGYRQAILNDDKLLGLKSRIDKAVEYINNLSNEPNVFGHYGIDGNCKKYLFNILQGEDTK